MVLASRSCARKIKGLLLLLDLSKYAKFTMKEKTLQKTHNCTFLGGKNQLFSLCINTTVILLYSHCMTPSMPPKESPHSSHPTCFIFSELPLG